jgi:hypothetical protein
MTTCAKPCGTGSSYKKRRAIKGRRHYLVVPTRSSSYIFSIHRKENGMRHFVTIVILFVLTVLVVPAFSELPPSAVTEADVQDIIQTESESAQEDPQVTWPTFNPAGEKLVERMRDGFLKTINRESNKWYECGQLTPEEDKPLRTEKIARYTLAALREYDLRWLNPWGVLAVIVQRV